MEWVPHNHASGPHQELPEDGKEVLVRVAPDRAGTSCSVAVGYLKYSAGDKTCPYFVVPGVGGPVIAWADGLGDGFVWPKADDDHLELGTFYTAQGHGCILRIECLRNMAWLVTIECPGRAPIRVVGRPCASGVISDARDRIEELIRWSPETAPWLGSVSVELRELAKFMRDLDQLHWVNIWATQEDEMTDIEQASPWVWDDLVKEQFAFFRLRDGSLITISKTTASLHYKTRDVMLSPPPDPDCHRSDPSREIADAVARLDRSGIRIGGTSHPAGTVWFHWLEGESVRDFLIRVARDIVPRVADTVTDVEICVFPHETKEDLWCARFGRDNDLVGEGDTVENARKDLVEKAMSRKLGANTENL